MQTTYYIKSTYIEFVAFRKQVIRSRETRLIWNENFMLDFLDQREFRSCSHRGQSVCKYVFTHLYATKRYLRA